MCQNQPTTLPLSLALSLSNSIRFTSESSGTFFFSWRDLGIFYGPFTVRAEQRGVMKKSQGCSHTLKDLYPYVALAQAKCTNQIIALPDHSHFSYFQSNFFAVEWLERLETLDHSFTSTFLIALEEIPPATVPNSKGLPFDHARSCRPKEKGIPSGD